ncbi:MAG: tRNA dihydrouridine synthase DusB [Deltaproteobacteria bacterium]|nr:tRNA dihydrouridine synthase DusB [Deltaproteobacteria bacterium]NND28126.1 tRNA dihydrouridine synthase DusB [Myxococcales bacterium]MBT8463147.1 tRNA dihydrouridine synthase DusB [Deltaproteobacteria bacterium]MBT8480188.1 tRNA dihydrouridine synthase DusB [Deltaproteobacteria bacterium]NNK08020.1 tRNA dihydrouridine synthase DusB [Myxococcales bacterium]
MEQVYKSELNRNVPLASPNEFAAIEIGPLSVWPPVVLAPMAGVTNWPFRSICRQFGAGLYVSEMVTARPLVEGRKKTLMLAEFGEDEAPRSLQLYGVDPHYVGEAVKWLVGEGRVDHIDMNFGCPVPKVTRKGGGSAIPAKPQLLAKIVRAAVNNAGETPITIKFRMGIDETLLTYEDAGRIAEQEGCAAVALHARTAAQLYDGEAQWDAIAALKKHVQSIPVLGNGDIWEAHDALRMMRSTGCDGVVIGRGCLGRPWLFRDLADVFEGREPQNPPTFGEVAEIAIEHAALLSEWAGEAPSMRMFRRHSSWYTKGFRGSAKLRARLMRVTELRELAEVLRAADRSEPFPPDAMRVPRGKTAGRQKVSLPEGFLQNRLTDDTSPVYVDPGSGG